MRVTCKHTSSPSLPHQQTPSSAHCLNLPFARSLSLSLSLARARTHLEKTEVKVHTYTTYNDYYPFFLKIAFAILMVELILSQLVWRKIP